MKANLTSVMAELAVMAFNATDMNVAPDNDGKTGPFSVRFRPSTKLFIEKQSALLGISGSELVNMIVEGAIREITMPFESMVTSVYERFVLLMRAHDVGIVQTADLLKPFNIKLSILEDRQRTLDYLTIDVLHYLSEQFCVSFDWLTGKSDVITDSESQDHYPAIYVDNMLANKGPAPRVVFIKSNKGDTAIWILKKTHCNNVIKPFSISGVSAQSELQAFFRFLEKNGILKTTILNITQTEMEKLKTGKILPILLYKKWLPYFTENQPDEYESNDNNMSESIKEMAINIVMKRKSTLLNF
ncbi:hypothetical protein [Dickeya poaceiphila]|uniref:Uncharacterized protein n=1 Tax=Dickeya poaceiphila TaxID=568768 RepID=A0A5B8I9S9_9GAMM|nr:hypothetical protein [Dickeya poaceiphila]QDX30923.1 hypothetical protein Dpoa569_0002872 [Dickeya poaceiphila]